MLFTDECGRDGALRQLGVHLVMEAQVSTLRAAAPAAAAPAAAAAAPAASQLRGTPTAAYQPAILNVSVVPTAARLGCRLEVRHACPELQHGVSQVLILLLELLHLRSDGWRRRRSGGGTRWTGASS